MSGVSGIYRYYVVSTILFIFLAIVNFMVAGMGIDASLQTMPGIIGGFYIAMGVLSMLVFWLLSRFLSKTPEDFASLGIINRLLGWLLKLLPGLMVLTHYLIFIFIFIQWIQIIPNLLGDSPAFAALVINAITTNFWFGMHCLGAYIKSIIYSDPFWYKPDEERLTCVGLFFRKLGP